MSTLYSTKVTAVGGRSGTVRSDDGLLDLPLALPSALGGKGGATNPEQLFAATRPASAMPSFTARATSRPRSATTTSM